MSSLLAVGTALSVWAILLTVQVPVIALSTFRFSVSKNVQVSTNYCSPLSGRKMSRIKCAGGCTTLPGCQGFSFTCNSVTKQCQCLLCSAFNISTATSVPGVFVGVFKSTGKFLQVADCGPPPDVSRTVHSNESTLSGYNVTYQCSSPYLYIKGTTTAFCQYNGTWTVPTIKCGVCGAPLLVNRTFVVHSNTADQYDVALYNCSVSTDVYVKGTNNVTCNTTSAWPVPTILCAPTTCYYKHSIWGSVYKGNLTTTLKNCTCNLWTSDTPNYRTALYKDDSNYIVDGSMANAKNYCRIFNDGTYYTWCYTTDPNTRWDACGVPACSPLPGQVVD